MHCNGIISPLALAVAGCHLGNEATVMFSRMVLTCGGLSSRSLTDFSYAGNTGGAFARIEGVPEKSGLPEIKITTGGAVRATFTSTSLDLTTGLSVTGDVIAPNMMPRSELASTYQPLLSSTYDDSANGFHSILASSPHGIVLL